MPKSGSKGNVIRHWPQVLILLVAALLVACRSSATATPAASGSSDLTPNTASGSAPTAPIEATEEAPAMVAPACIINMGQKETGIFEAHPSKSSSPRIQFTSSSVGEGLITITPISRLVPCWPHPGASPTTS